MKVQQKNRWIKYPCLYAIIACTVAGLYGCTGIKRLPAGESLYTGADLKITTQGRTGNIKQVRSELEELIQPKPNFSIFGSRPLLWIYQIVDEPKKDKGLKHWLKNKVGE